MKQSTIRVFLLFLAIFSGCVPLSTSEPDCDPDYEPDYDRVLEVVLDAWRDRYEYITNGSANAIERSVLKEVDKLTLNESCEGTEKTVGCYHSSTDEIFILESRSGCKRECTASHEYLHLLLNHEHNHLLSYYEPESLQGSHSDPDHSNPDIWNEFGDDTIEAIVCKTLAALR